MSTRTLYLFQYNTAREDHSKSKPQEKEEKEEQDGSGG